MAATSSNMQVVLDFLVNLKVDPSTISKVSKTLQDSMPKNLVSEEAITNTIAGLKTIQESGVDVSTVFEEMMASFDDTALQDLSLEFGSLMEDVSNLDTTAIDDMLASLSPEQVAGFGQALQEAFANFQTPEMQSKLQGIAQEFEKIKPKIKEEGEGLGHAAGEGVKHGFNIKEIAQMALGMFGGQAIMSGMSGFTHGLESIFEKGVQVFETLDRMELGFTSAGLAGEGLEKQLAATSSFADILSEKFAVSATTIKEYSAQAGLLGGATGKMNEDVTKLVTGLVKASGGMVDSTMLIRTFTRGITDPEAEATLGRLKMTFPQLATALKNVTNPADLTRVALEKMTPMFGMLEKQASGPGETINRFKNSIEKLTKSLGVTLVEGFMPLITFISSDVVPAMLGTAKVVGDVTKWMGENKKWVIAVIAPLAILTAAYVYQNTVMATAVGLKVLEAKQWVIATALKIKAFIAEKFAVEGTTAAHKVLNLVMSANPYIAVIAGIVALIGVLNLLYDAGRKAAQERLEAAKTLKQENDTLIEVGEKKKELIKNDADLVASFIKQGEAAKDNAELLSKLEESYPGVYKASKTYAENVEALSQASRESVSELDKVDKTLLKLKEREIDINIKINKEKIATDIEDIKNEIDKAEGGFWGWITRIAGGTSGAISQVQIDIEKGLVEGYATALGKAKNNRELANALINFQQSMSDNASFKGLSATEQKSIIDKAKEAYKKEVEARKKLAEQPQEIISLWREAGKSDVEIISGIAKQFKISTVEAGELLKKQKEQEKTAKDTTTAVTELANSFNDAKKKANELLQIQIAALAQKILEKGNTKELVEEGKKLKKSLDEKNAAEDKAGKLLGVGLEKGKTKLESAEQEYNIQSKILELNNELTTAQIKAVAVAQNRKLTDKEELLIAEKNQEKLKDQLAEYLKIYEAKGLIDKLGNVNLNLSKEKQIQVREGMQSLITSINESGANIIELKTKVNPDELQKLRDEFKMKELQLDLEIGIDPEKTAKAMTDLIQGQILGLQENLANAILVKDEKLALALQTQIMDKEKQLADILKSYSNKRIEDIKEESDKEIELTTQKYDKLIEAAKRFNDIWKQTKDALYEKEKNNELKSLQSTQDERTKILDKQKGAELLSESEYQYTKEKLDEEFAAKRENKEKEIANRKKALDNAFAGGEIYLQNQKDIALLREKQSFQKQQYDILQEEINQKKASLIAVSPIDEKRLSDLKKNLDATTDLLDTKSSYINQLFDTLGTQVGEGLAGLFAGNQEAMHDAMKTTLALIVGYIDKLVEEMILTWVMSPSVTTWIAALPFPFNLALLPAAKAMITPLVHALADPLLKDIASFSTGGRVDTPIQFVAGDGSKLGGLNREWIFRDEQLKQTVKMAVNYQNQALLLELQSLRQLIGSQELITALRGEDIQIALKRTNYNLARRAL